MVRDIAQSSSPTGPQKRDRSDERPLSCGPKPERVVLPEAVGRAIEPSHRLCN